ncbi:acyl-homoserine-lactone synthase [Mesorhizobium sp. KR1-2]|uniref:acyl-homoserine-lactone synthase n=1 Tax=Mesorhizobium sp. KR1-2 TaxID=3156609 RepID=UPI0032B45735
MFITIQAHEYGKYQSLLDQMHRLRKRVFKDQLGWDVPVQGEHERDRYDDMKPVYVVWCSPDAKTLYGSMRLMPTTGPTLLYDVFRRTFPHAADLTAPGIWEATRTCIDVEAIARDHPDTDPARAFGLLCLATAECAVAHGIRTMICNYEPHMARVYGRAGLEVQELGRADGYGRRPVCCGGFAMTKATVARMRSVLKVDLPLYHRGFASSSAVAGLAA